MPLNLLAAKSPCVNEPRMVRSGSISPVHSAKSNAVTSHVGRPLIDLSDTLPGSLVAAFYVAFPIVDFAGAHSLLQFVARSYGPRSLRSSLGNVLLSNGRIDRGAYESAPYVSH